MPLVVLCGCPSTGKTKRAKELVEYLTENRPKTKTVVVDDGSIDRNIVYADSKKEVTTRGALKSSVERELNADTVVIVDSLNYIKGFRYELHCVSKYARTTHCVVHCAASKENMYKFNELKHVEELYSHEILEALQMRFETPNSMARWDSPLFTVQVDDDMPCQAICEAIFNAKAPKPNMSTQNPPLMSPTFVHEADKLLQSIGAAILSAQKTANLGDTVTLSGCNEIFTINQIISIADMRRHRKQFLTYLRANPVANIKDVPKTFLSFLTTAVA